MPDFRKNFDSKLTNETTKLDKRFDKKAHRFGYYLVFTLLRV